MSSEHVAHLQRMANESWIGSPERAALDAAIAVLSAPQPPAEARSGDWVMVPREPTQAMLDAGHWPCVQGRGAKSVWATMLAAAPQQPAAVDGVDWRALYRLQTAMRYMDNNAQLTKDRAYRMADNDIAGLELQQGGES